MGLDIVVHLPVDSEQSINSLVADIGQDFPTAKIGLEVRSRKLLASEIVLAIVINVVSSLTYDIVKRILSDLSKRGVKDSYLEPELRRAVAESFLIRSAVKGLKLDSMSDSGEKSTYLFRDNKKHKHTIVVHSNGNIDYNPSSSP